MDERWLCLLLLLLVVLLPSFPSASSTKTRGSQTRRSTFPFTGRGAESQFILFGGAARTRRRPAHPRQGFAQKDANQDGPARERHRERDIEREREREREGGRKRGCKKVAREKSSRKGEPTQPRPKPEPKSNFLGGACKTAAAGLL